MIVCWSTAACHQATRCTVSPLPLTCVPGGPCACYFGFTSSAVGVSRSPRPCSAVSACGVLPSVRASVVQRWASPTTCHHHHATSQHRHSPASEHPPRWDARTVIGCLHDPANVQQTSSIPRLLDRVNAP